MTDTFDEIAEALDGESPPTPTLVERGFNGILAVDVWRAWGAAFYLRVSARGQWSSDIYLEHRNAQGVWEPLGDSGMHGDTWSTKGWAPSMDDTAIRLGQRHGVIVDDEAGDEIDLVASAGYTGTAVYAVEVVTDGACRVLDVKPGLRAVVVVAPGGSLLHPLDRAGNRTGDPLAI